MQAAGLVSDGGWLVLRRDGHRLVMLEVASSVGLVFFGSLGGTIKNAIAPAANLRMINGDNRALQVGRLSSSFSTRNSASARVLALSWVC